MRLLPCRAGWVLSIVILLSSVANPVVAEFEVDLDTGLWIPFLPDYTAGSIVSGGVAQQRDLFRDDQTDVGAQVGLSGFYRLQNSGRRLDWDLGLAGIDSMGSTGTFADPGVGTSVWFASLDGIGRLNTANGDSATFALDSDVLYTRQYVGIGDTFLLHGDPRREVDLGIGFSHLQFNQDFNLQALFPIGAGATSLSGQYLEELDTNYLGGEIRGSAIRRHNHRDWLLEFGVGFFNMNAEYLGQSTLFNTVGTAFDNDVIVDEIDEFAVTVDLALRLDTEIAGVGVRPGVAFKYISDMPRINHPMTEAPAPISDPAFISTESGYFLGVNVEVFLLDHCSRCRR